LDYLEIGLTMIDPGIIAAIIAFLGTIITFFWRKSLEKRSINRAILAEIQRLIRVVTIHEKWWAERLAAKDTNFPLIPFSHAVYSKQVPNVGALNHRVVANVVTFYGYVRFLNSLQEARPEYIAAQKQAEFDITYHAALKTLLQEYSHAFDEEFKGLV
jgi:hypothetical protein